MRGRLRHIPRGQTLKTCEDKALRLVREEERAGVRYCSCIQGYPIELNKEED